MAYCVLHVQKFKPVDVRGLEIHINRESKNSKNKDIDYERTKDNINVMDLTQRPGQFRFRDRVKNILADRLNADKKIRKDAVVICSVIVSASPEYFEGKTREQIDNYFIAAANGLQDFFGGPGNTVGGYVHYDEGCPHMHYLFCPKTSDNRLCAKEVITKKSLIAMQDRIPQYLQEHGFDVERGVKDSPRYHVDTADWKRDNLIMEATKEKLMQELSGIEPTKMLGKSVLSDENYAKLKGIADQSVHAIANKAELDRLEREKQTIKIMKIDMQEKNKEALAEIEERQKKIEELIASERQKLESENEALNARERTLADRERRLESYRKIVREQDKNVALQTALEQAEQMKAILEKREKYLEEREEKIKNDEAAAVVRVREAAKKAIMEEVKKQGKENFWKAAAMNDLKETNPTMYEKLIANVKKKSLNRSREIADKNLENEKDFSFIRK